MEKCSRAGESTDDNIMHEHFSLDMKGYKHPLKEYEIVVAFILQQWLQECASMLHYPSTSPVLFQGCIVTDTEIVTNRSLVYTHFQLSIPTLFLVVLSTYSIVVQCPKIKEHKEYTSKLFRIPNRRELYVHPTSP